MEIGSRAGRVGALVWLAPHRDRTGQRPELSTAGEPADPRATAGRRTDRRRADDEEIVDGVFLPPDRTAKRRLEAAEEMIGEARYGECGPLSWARCLEGSEDFFFRPEGPGTVYRSLKAEAGRLIAGLPRRGARVVRTAIRPARRGGCSRRRWPAATWPTWPKSRGDSFTPRPAPKRRCCWPGNISTTAAAGGRVAFARLARIARAGQAVRADVVALSGHGLARAGMPEQAQAVLVALKHDGTQAEVRIGRSSR